jgi:hypothetical protein
MPVAEAPAGRGGGTSRPKLLALAALALLVVGGAVAGIVVATSGGGGKSSKKAASGSLLSVLVPTEVAKACTKSAAAKGAIESYSCKPGPAAAGSFPDSLELSFYPKASAVTTAYNTEKAKSGVQSNAGRCDRVNWSGEGSWHHAATGKLGGRRLCYIDSAGNSWVVWTHVKLSSTDHFNTLGIAEERGRGSQTTLFSWWHPLHEIIGKCRPQVSKSACESIIKRDST